MRWLPPESELEERFLRAGGPGGQHVDRSETAVQLRFDVVASRHVPDRIKPRLLRLAGRRADTDGVITIQSGEYRSQHRNRQEVRRRLAELIEQASRIPKPRRKTAPSRAAKKKRLRDKRRRSDIKRKRTKPGPND